MVNIKKISILLLIATISTVVWAFGTIILGPPPTPTSSQITLGDWGMTPTTDALSFEIINYFPVRMPYAAVTGLIQDVSEIVIPQYYNGYQVRRIAAGAFNGVTTLTGVMLNDNLQIIEDFAFAGTSITEINIPGSVISIGQQAFFEITTLTSVTFNDGLEIIGWAAFALTSIYELYIPGSVISIEEAAFLAARNLNFLVLNEGLIYIESYAFYRTEIYSVLLPRSLFYIGYNAFPPGTQFLQHLY